MANGRSDQGSYLQDASQILRPEGSPRSLLANSLVLILLILSSIYHDSERFIPDYDSKRKYSTAQLGEVVRNDIEGPEGKIEPKCGFQAFPRNLCFLAYLSKKMFPASSDYRASLPDAAQFPPRTHYMVPCPQFFGDSTTPFPRPIQNASF
jgi:hypothetical protein